MACTDEDTEWVSGSSPRLNLFACPSVSLAEGLNSISGPIESGDPTNQGSCASGAAGEVSRVGAECIEIVVDSLADESCLPANFQLVGESMGSDGPGFLDAQGKELHIHDRRTLVLELPTVSGEVKRFRETCLISSVSSPLFAVGKLYKLGWGLFWEGDQFMLGKQGSPSTYIPVYFKHNSLVAMGHVRRAQVSLSQPSSPQAQSSSHHVPQAQASSPHAPQAQVSHPHDPSGAVASKSVRVVATVGPVLERLLRGYDYFHELVPGVWGLRLRSDKHVDITEAMPDEGMSYRTTLIKQGDAWKLLEMSEDITMMDDLSEPFPDVIAPVDCIVLAHRVVCSPSELGFNVPEAFVPPSLSVRAKADRVPEVDMEGEVEGQALPDASGQVSGPEVQVHNEVHDPEAQASLHASRADDGEQAGDLPPELEIHNVIIRPDDSLKTLRQAATAAGVGKFGGKRTVYRRLAAWCSQRALSDRVRAPVGPQPNMVPAFVEPSEAEKQQHRLTHLPYQAWCTLIVFNIKPGQTATILQITLGEAPPSFHMTFLTPLVMKMARLSWSH